MAWTALAYATVMPDDAPPNDKPPPVVQPETVPSIIRDKNEEQRHEAARKLAERHNAGLRSRGAGSRRRAVLIRPQHISAKLVDGAAPQNPHLLSPGPDRAPPPYRGLSFGALCCGHMLHCEIELSGSALRPRTVARCSGPSSRGKRGDDHLARAAAVHPGGPDRGSIVSRRE